MGPKSALLPRARETRRRDSSATLSFSHGVNDLYQGAVPALVPFLVLAHGWSYTMAGGLMLAATVLSSVAQPLFGWWTDRRAAPWLVPAGLLVAGLGIAVTGLSSSFAMVCAAMGISGLGVAAYHPESARLARGITRGSHRAMGWFSLSGNVGFAAAPLLISPLIAVAGLTATPVLVLPALATAVLVLWLVPATRVLNPTPEEKAAVAPHAVGLSDDWPNFVKLTGVIVLRSIVNRGLGTFLALLVLHRTGSALAGQVALAAFFAAGAAGTLVGGMLVDRGFRRTRVLCFAYAASVPALLLVAVLPGWLVLVAAALIGLTLYLPFSLHVTLGQDYLPSRVGTASGVTLGLAVSAGGVFTPFLGDLADRTSVAVAIGALSTVMVVSLVLSLLLREPKPD